MPANLDLPLYLNLSLYSFLVFGALIGFAKGFKKSLFSFVTTLAFYVVFFLTIDMAITFLWSVQIPQLGQLFGMLDASLSSATSFSQVAPMALELYLGSEYSAVVTNTNFLALAAGLGMFALKLVYTILYFTIFFLIYKLFCLILRSFILGGKKKTDKYVSKNRFLGLVFGAMEGAIALYVSLIMIGGVISIADSLVTLAPVDDTEEVDLAFPREHLYEAGQTLLAESILPTVPPELTAAIAELKAFTEAYHANLIVAYSSQVVMPDDDGIDTPLNIYLFDEVLSFEYNANQVSIRKELTTFASIGSYVLDMDYVETSDITDITGDNIRDIFTLLSRSDLLVSILPLGIEMAAIQMEVPLTIPSEDLYAIDWQVELNQLGVIAATAFDIISQIGILEGEANYEELEIDGNTMRDLFDSLADSQLMTLAAYVAIEPILSAAGENVQAIVRLPEDMDWSEIDWGTEFTAIGSILGAVLDTDITYSQLTSGDYGLILNAVASIDFTVLLESKIITYSLINVLSGDAGIAGLDMIIIPSDIIWLDEFDGDGNLLVAGELRNILLAISAMTSIVGELDFDNLSPDVLTDLSDDAIDTIFNSRVLVATLSSVLMDIPLGDFSIIVPDSAVDDDFYIIKEEFSNMLKAIKLIMAPTVCEEDDVTCDPDEIDYLGNALSLTDDEIDILLASNILAATVGNLLNDMAGDTLTIPTNTLETIEVAYPEVDRGTDLSVISKVEIKKAIQAVMVIGITDITNMTFDASIINNLADPLNPDILDDAKLDKLFGSGILHATISKVLLDLAEGVDSFVTVPYNDVDNVDVRTTVEGIEYISVQELKNALNALFSLDITDFNNIEALNLNLILDNLSTLLDSAILHATVSKQLQDLGTDIIVIPYFDEAGNSIRITVGEPGFENFYIISSELEAAFDSLELLEIEDLNEFSGTFDMTLLTTEGNIDILLSSAVIHATVSKTLFDMTEGLEATLAVPYFDQDGNPIRVTVGDALEDTDTTYLKKTEIRAIIDSLDVFGIGDIASFDGTFEMTALTEEGNIAILLESAVIHATVSKTLFDMTEGLEATLAVPYFDQDGNAIRVTVGDSLIETDTTYLLKTEIEAIIDALDVFGIDDIESFDGSFDMTALTTEGNITILLTSAVIHATVSQTLFDMTEGLEATLAVPYFDENGNPIRVTVGDPLVDTDTTYLLKTEIEAIIDALDVFGIGDIESFDGTFDMAALTAEGNITILLTSAVIHATVSQTLFDMGEGPTAALKIPYFDEDNISIRSKVGVLAENTETNYLKKTEIEAIIDALNILIIDDDVENGIDSFTGTFDMTALTAPGNIGIVMNSAVIHATISDILLEMGYDDPLTLADEAALAIPYFDEDNLPIRVTVGVLAENTETKYLKSTEIEAIVNALDILEMTNIDSFAGGFDMTKLTGEGNIVALLESAIIHATISNTLLDMTADGFLSIPYFDELGQSIRAFVGDALLETDTTYLLKTEISAIVEALDTLNMLSLDEFEGTFDMTLLTVPGNIDILLASSVIQATISDTFLTMKDSGALNIPYFDELSTPIIVSVGVVLENTDTIYVVKDEIKAVVAALDKLEMTNLDDFGGTFNMSLLTAEGNITILLASSIIHATISDTLFEMTEGVNSSLIIPYYNDSEIAIIREVGDELVQTNTTYILKSEIESLVAGLDAFGVLNLDSFTGTFDLSTLTEPGNLTTMLLSSIIHATISDTLFGMSATLLIPYFNENDQEVIVSVGDILESTDTDYITKTELEALVAGLDALGMTNLDSFTGTFDLASLTSGDNMATLLSSAIIHASISDTLLEMNTSGSINVPYFDEVSAEIIILSGVILNNTDTLYIASDELIAMVDALDILGVNDINSFTGTVSFANLFIGTNLDTVLLSSILQATISEQMFDIGTAGTIILPDEDINGTDIVILVGAILDGTDTTYVKRTEIKYFFEAMNMLGSFEDIDAFDGAFSLTVLATLESQDKLLLSATMHATISNTVLDLDDAVLIVPLEDQLDNDIQITTSDTFVIKGEIKALINAFLEMGFSDLDSFGVALSSTAFFENTDILLLSASIQATISDKMLNDTGGVLLIPDTDTVTLDTLRFVHADVTLIDVNEIKATMAALESMDLMDFGGMSFNPGNILNQDLDILLASASIRATISKTLLDAAADETEAAGFSGLIVPRAKREAILVAGIGKTQIESVELRALLDSLEMLGVSDFGAAFNPAVIMQMNETELNDFLNSGSIHTTIDKMLKGNANISGSIPSQALFTMYPASAYPIAGMITKAELVNFIRAVQVLGGDNFTTFNVDYASISGKTTAEHAIILNSMIIRNIITNDIETAVGVKNFTVEPDFILDAEDYMDNNITTFLTYEDSIEVMKFLKDEPYTD